MLASIGKGTAVGYLAGLVADRRQSVAVGVLARLFFGLALSFRAALGQGDHYLEIVLPGMLVERWRASSRNAIPRAVRRGYGVVAYFDSGDSRGCDGIAPRPAAKHPGRTPSSVDAPGRPLERNN